MIRLSQGLATGHPEVDGQHEQLFLQVAALAAALEAGDAAEAQRTFGLLGDQLAEHFAAEERLMEALDPALAEPHRAAHAAFLRDCGRLQERLRRAAPPRGLELQVRGWLSSWLREHAAGLDLDLVGALPRRGRPAAATATPRPPGPG